MVKAIILGAGIGGLTAAHELIKKGFNVEVYEHRSVVGGLARSEGVPGSGIDGRRDLPGEYSWRIYGIRYYNLLRVMREIPTDNNNSVFSNLIEIERYLLVRENELQVFSKENTSSSVRSFLKRGTIMDICRFFSKMLFYLTACKERVNNLDHVTWSDFIRSSKLSEEGYKQLVCMAAPFYGARYDKVSAPIALEILTWLLYYAASPATFFVMKKPTNEAWFDPWVDHLRREGVQFHLETAVKSLEIKDNKITHMSILDKNKKEVVVDADYFVCGLPVESMARIMAKNTIAQKFTTIKNQAPLAEVGKQHMFSIQYYFTEKIILKQPNFIIYMPDTPWLLIIKPEGTLWDVDMSEYGDGKICDVWSVGIDSEIDKGICGKTLTECTPEEVEKEVWHQIISSKSLLENISTKSGKSLHELGYERCFVWPSYQYKNGSLQTDEPKFSNNAGTLKLRPHPITELENLFYATAYTITDTQLYCMEAAAEAGVYAANGIFAKENPEIEKVPVIYKKQSFAIFAPFKALDYVLFKCGLFDVNKFILFILLLIIAYKLYLQ